MRMIGQRQQQEDSRDLMEPPSGQPDPIVVRHIQEAIEYLQEHMEHPCLGSYQAFLHKEQDWIDNERRIRRGLTRPLS